MEEKKRTLAFIIIISLIMIALVIGYIIFGPGTKNDTANNNSNEEDIDVGDVVDLEDRNASMTDKLNALGLNEFNDLLETYNIYSEIETLDSEVTILAPTNQALRNAATSEDLEQLVRNHVLTNETFTNTLDFNNEFITLGGETVRFAIDNGAIVVQTANDVIISSPDNAFQNGVIHVIPEVLEF